MPPKWPAAKVREYKREHKKGAGIHKSGASDAAGARGGGSHFNFVEDSACARAKLAAMIGGCRPAASICKILQCLQMCMLSAYRSNLLVQWGRRHGKAGTPALGQAYV